MATGIAASSLEDIRVETLFRAASSGRGLIELRRFLQTYPGVSLEVRPNDLTALQTACAHGHVSVAELLLDHGAQWYTTTPVQGLTVLHLASQQGHVEMVELLLNWQVITMSKAEANAEIREDYNQNWWLNHRTRSGRTPLSLAVTAGHLDVVELLMERGADISIVDASLGWSPLWWAATACYQQDQEQEQRRISFVGHETPAWAIFLHILEQYMTPESKGKEEGHPILDQQRDAQGETILTFYASQGRVEVVQALVNVAGASPMAANSVGSSALHIAAGNSSSRQDVLEVLLSAVSDKDLWQHNEQGETPLECASKRGHLGAIFCIIRAHINLEGNLPWSQRTR